MYQRRLPSKRLVFLGVLATAVSLAAGLPAALPLEAQGPAGQRLFGHDNGRSSTIEIDTATGRARIVGPIGWRSGSSGMATAFATVLGPGGRRFAAGTFFGVITDDGSGNDFVVVVDPLTGQGEKIVQTSQNLGGRGIAFGADGATLYAIDGGDLARIDVASGQVDAIGRIQDASGRRYNSTNLEWDPDSRRLVSIMAGGTSGSQELVLIDPATGQADSVGPVGVSACTLIRAPNPVPGPGGADWPAGSWFTIDQNSAELVRIDFDPAARTARVAERIGDLGPESTGQVCGTAFTLPQIPPTPTALPTATLVPNGPSCICDKVLARVPRAVINYALANPDRIQGWQQLLDPNKPPSPGNPRRECLNLRTNDQDFHWLFNSPIWRVGCH